MVTPRKSNDDLLRTEFVQLSGTYRTVSQVCGEPMRRLPTEGPADGGQHSACRPQSGVPLSDVVQ